MIKITHSNPKGTLTTFLSPESIELVSIRQDSKGDITQCVVKTNSGDEMVIPRSQKETIDLVMSELKLDVKAKAKSVKKK